nr:putative Gag-polypeptide of LTR copia-type [Tanacetum cinerariifolium]
MEKGIRDSVKYANTSSKIWSDLKRRFGKESAPKAYELKKKITATRQEGSGVSTYYTRLRDDLSHGSRRREKDDKAKPKAAYVETGTSPITGLNEGQYQEFVKFFSRSSNNVEAKPKANMAGASYEELDWIGGEQSCFDGPPQNPSSTTTEDIGSEEENVAQHENDLFGNNSPVLGLKIEEDHAISHKEPKPKSKRVRTQPAHLSEYFMNLPSLVTNS